MSAKISGFVTTEVWTRIDDGDGYASLLLHFRSDSPSVPPHRPHLCDRQPKTDRPWPYVRRNARLMILHTEKLLMAHEHCSPPVLADLYTY